jgi:hypothetical protein
MLGRYASIARYFLSTIIFILALSSVGFTQKLWEKSMTSWSGTDCHKILIGSPWATSVTGTGDSRDDILLRWFSSATVHKAMLRCKQVGQKYDKMAAEERQRFDAENASALDCADCKNYYILLMLRQGYAGTGPGVGDLGTLGIGDLGGRYFVKYSFADLKGNIYLENDQGERRQLAKYIQPTDPFGYAVLYFDRFDQAGKPLVTATSKTFTLVNQFSRVESHYTFVPARTEFKVSSMLIAGDLDL